MCEGVNRPQTSATRDVRYQETWAMGLWLVQSLANFLGASYYVLRAQTLAPFGAIIFDCKNAAVRDLDLRLIGRL